MKQFILGVFSLIVLIAVAAGAAVWYVQPDKPLDLVYSKVTIEGKIIDMVQRLSFDVRLTEADLDNLVKGSLAAKPQLPNALRITGASTALDGDRLTVDVNAVWKDTLPFTATLTYRIAYAEPNLTLHRESVRIKRFALPADWLKAPDFTYNLNDKLPKHVGIKGVQFDRDAVLISLKLR